MIHDFRQIKKFVNDLEQGAKRKYYDQVYDAVIIVLQDAHEYYFTQEIDPWGVGWTELAQSTIDRKGHDRILYESGNLMDSLSEPNAENAIRIETKSVGSLEILFGTAVEYAQYHQYDSGIPIRQHVGMDETLADIIAEKALNQIMENIL